LENKTRNFSHKELKQILKTKKWRFKMLFVKERRQLRYVELLSHLLYIRPFGEIKPIFIAYVEPSLVKESRPYLLQYPARVEIIQPESGNIPTLAPGKNFLFEVLTDGEIEILEPEGSKVLCSCKVWEEDLDAVLISSLVLIPSFPTTIRIKKDGTTETEFIDFVDIEND
jgi:hypothetical protein